MSYTEVRRLIDEGRLDQAIQVARFDIEQEKNEWSCLGLFDVIKECCIKEINEGHEERAEKCLNQMEVVARGVKDTVKATKTIENLRFRMIPDANIVLAAMHTARQGNAHDAYVTLRNAHHANPLDDRLHEQYGQLIYYYLREGLRVMGAEAAQEALDEYLSLNNPRPSTLHSSIANMASHVCAEYPEIRLIPFIEKWGIKNLTENDLKAVELADRNIAPLYQRLIDRCIQLNEPIEKIIDLFTQNENISREEINDRICRRLYGALYDAAKHNPQEVIEVAKTYVEQLKGLEIHNQYHSKALNTILMAVQDEHKALFADIMELWGLNNFREEDWQKPRKANKEQPSLAQRALQTYVESLRICRRQPADNFEQWLDTALTYDPKNEFCLRQKARLTILKGDKDKAIDMYKKMLISNNKSYLWHELSQATDDPELRKAALCKAVLSEIREEMLGDIRLKLAEIMIEDGQQNEALRELHTYYNTYTQNQWRIKPAFDTLQRRIEPGIQPTPNNRTYYIENSKRADDFLQSGATTETMKAIEILKRKNKATNQDFTLVTLLSAKGDKAQTSIDRLNLNEGENAIGKTFEVTYIETEDKLKIFSIKPSATDLNLSSLVVAGYVDGLDRARGWYHIYGTDSTHYVTENPSVEIRIGDFVEFYPIVPKDNTFKTAAVIGPITYKEGVERFGTQLAVVARVDYSKHQFNCICENGKSGLVGYDNGSAPQPGEMLRVAYIIKKDKNQETTYVKYISVEPTTEECETLRKTVTGPIHLLRNEKGFDYGFVNFDNHGYYVSGYQMKGKDIAEGDIITAKVVNNGDNWFAYEITTEK